MKSKTIYMVKTINTDGSEEELSDHRSANKAISVVIEHAKAGVSYLLNQRAQIAEARSFGEHEQADRQETYLKRTHRIDRYEVVELVYDETGECVECGVIFAAEG